MVEGWHTALSTARAASYPRQQRPTYVRLRPLPPGAGYARARLRRCIPSYPRSRSGTKGGEGDPRFPEGAFARLA